MTQVAAVLLHVLVAVCLGALPLSIVGLPFISGLALATVRAVAKREYVDIGALDAMACAVGMGAALAGSYLALGLGLGAARAGALLLVMLALVSTFRWRVRCRRTSTEVARTLLGLPWRGRGYDGRARVEETGWGDASDPAAIEVLVGKERVCELGWILRHQGTRAARVLNRANTVLIDHFGVEELSLD
jgi:hypothetical protein